MSKQSIKSTAKSTLASLLDASRVLDLAAHLKKQGPTILMYHRIVSPESLDTPLEPGMFVRPETFKMQMQVLSEHYTFISIQEIYDHYHRGLSLPPHAICVTFDDGWIDNYTNAFPILTQYSVPACIFLPTSFVGTTKQFWTQSFARFVSKLKSKKEFSATHELITACGFLSSESKIALGQLVANIENRGTSKENDYIASALTQLKRESYTHREAFLDRVIDDSETRTETDFMSWEQVKEMRAKGISFGNHSHSHRMFSRLSDAEIQEDIASSNELLRTHLESVAPIFCYPEGDYSTSAHHSLASAGVRMAVSNRTDNYQETFFTLLERIGIHEDISNSEALFKARIAMKGLF